MLPVASFSAEWCSGAFIYYGLFYFFDLFSKPFDASLCVDFLGNVVDPMANHPFYGIFIGVSLFRFCDKEDSGVMRAMIWIQPKSIANVRKYILVSVVVNPVCAVFVADEIFGAICDRFFIHRADDRLDFAMNWNGSFLTGLCLHAACHHHIVEVYIFNFQAA